MREKEKVIEELEYERKELDRAENEIDTYGFKQEFITYHTTKIKMLEEELENIVEKKDVEIKDRFYLKSLEYILSLENPKEHWHYYYVLAYENYYKGRTFNGNKPLSFSDYKNKLTEESVKEIVEMNNLTLSSQIQE